MGNTYSAKTKCSFRTAAMAKYMTITKPQIMAIRNILLPLASKKRGSIKIEQFVHAIQQANVQDYPDIDVLKYLFHMWDLTGSGRVRCNEFITGISILSCKDDTIEHAIRFTLQVADRYRTGIISSRDAHTFLRSICVTSSYFGDQLLTLRQIYKVVDNVFETITLISQDDNEISHDEFVKELLNESSVHDIVIVDTKRAIMSRNGTYLGYNPDNNVGKNYNNNKNMNNNNNNNSYKNTANINNNNNNNTNTDNKNNVVNIFDDGENSLEERSNEDYEDEYSYDYDDPDSGSTSRTDGGIGHHHRRFQLKPITEVEVAPSYE